MFLQSTVQYLSLFRYTGLKNFKVKVGVHKLPHNVLLGPTSQFIIKFIDRKNSSSLLLGPIYIMFLATVAGVIRIHEKGIPMYTAAE